MLWRLLSHKLSKHAGPFSTMDAGECPYIHACPNQLVSYGS